MPPLPPPSDQMRASGSGRRKVALPPGRSQLDWIRNSARLLIDNRGTVTKSELRTHNKKHDTWIAVNSKVYNVTPYLEYHPGGIDILAAQAGKDATAAFNKYHAWVNVDFMLQRCVVGFLDADDDDKDGDSEDDPDEKVDDEKNDGGEAADGN